MTFWALLFLSFFLPELGNCLNDALFHKLPGNYLPDFVIRTEQTNSEFECSAYCSRADGCASVNYKNTGDGQGLCELNSGSLSEYPEDGVEKPEFTYLGIIKRNCEDKKKIFSPKTKRCESFRSCKELLKEDGSLGNGVYHLQLNDSLQQYPVYCHMIDIPECGSGGWTLVIKTNGTKNTFGHSSSYWSDKKTYQVQEGLEGLTEKESKLASYWSTPFTKICLGMSVQNGVSNWIKLDYGAISLYSVIAGGIFRATTAGRDTWKTLIEGSSLQPHCNREGFNNHMYSTNAVFVRARLAIIANNQNDCATCDSWIGFGVSFSGCFSVSTITSGNLALCSDNDNGHKATAAFGYLLVQ